MGGTQGFMSSKQAPPLIPCVRSIQATFGLDPLVFPIPPLVVPPTKVVCRVMGARWGISRVAKFSPGEIIPCETVPGRNFPPPLYSKYTPTVCIVLDGILQECVCTCPHV